MAKEEEARLKKRFVELAEKSYRQNIYCFTGFLGLLEQTLFYEAISQFPYVSYTAFGGNDACERQMIRFGDRDTLGYEEDFPIACLHIRPTAPKFAETLNHRDYLGTLMGLGIERSVLGDIFVTGKEAYVYCQDSMVSYICDNLNRVRHTAVVCEQAKKVPDTALPRLMEERVNVASERLDAVVAAVYHLSRSQSMELFRAGRIFINGRLTENNSVQPREGDIVSVRGFGRFIYRGIAGETRKGRIYAQVEIYH